MKRRATLRAAGLLATAVALIVLQGCGMIEGFSGIGGRVDFRKASANAIPQDAIDAAKDGKGFVRSDTSWGIGDAPDKASTTKTEDGWAPTPTPPPDPAAPQGNSRP